jgi:hypothetical protein
MVQALTVHAGIPRLPARQPPVWFRLDAARGAASQGASVLVVDLDGALGREPQIHG